MNPTSNFDNIIINCPNNKTSLSPRKDTKWFPLAPENGLIDSLNPSLGILSNLMSKFTFSNNNESNNYNLLENISTSSCDSIKSPVSTGPDRECNCHCSNKNIDNDDQNKKITILLSQVVCANAYDAKVIWKYLEESDLPNFLPIIADCMHRVNFEMLLTKAERFHSGFFSINEMQLFIKITSGPFKERKLASRILLDKLTMLLDSNDNIESAIFKKLSVKTPKHIVIIDTVIRILGNRALDLVQQDNGCFLIQYLYQHCSDKMKEFLTYYLLPRFKKLVKDRRGNYMCSMLITFTQDIKEDACDNDIKKMNLKKKQIWRNLVRDLIEDTREFYHLSCNEFGSFVMKKFVKHLEYDEQKSILFRLNALGLLSSMLSSEFGGFVLKNLLNSFKHHAHLLRSWHGICIP